MQPIDYRNATWTDLQDRITGLRAMVLQAWRVHGPGTTRRVALMAHMDILTFRPRTTELCQLGLLRLLEGAGGAHEGVYEAVPWEEAQKEFETRRDAAIAAHQPEFNLNA